MKKLLLVSTAIAGVAVMASPASAALKMDLGGYFDGYGVYADNNSPSTTSTLKQYAFRQDTDVFVNGKSTLDNGLTVGVHTDMDLGNNGAVGTANAATNSVALNQAYGYGSGGWGRINLGTADGAAYLLQVAAPSADSNIDGLRTSIQALNPTPTATDPRLAALLGDGAVAAGNRAAFGAATEGDLGYAQDDFRQTDRITYLTPKFNGFQAGASFAPQPGIAPSTAGMSSYVNTPVDGTAATFKNLWEAGARWDGEFQGVAGSLGAGYSDLSIAGTNLNATAGDVNLTDGVKTWNVGGNLAMSGFSLGGVYKESKVDEETFVDAAGQTGQVEDKLYDLGLGYDNGPYHVGGSYLHDHTNDPSFATAIGTTGDWMTGQDITDTRYTLGGGYTYAPGMTFRGSVAWGKFQNVETGVGTGIAVAGSQTEATGSNDYTQIAIGTDIQF